jgi:uncharacterized protein
MAKNRDNTPSNNESIIKSAGWLYGIGAIVWGLAFAAILAADGTVWWRIIRAATALLITVVLLWLSARKRKAGAGIGMFAGVAGLVTGITYGIRFLMIDGISWLSVTGLIVLLAGILLLFLSTKRLVTGLKVVWGIISGVLLFLAVVIIAWTAAPAVLATNMPPIPPGKETPTDYKLEAKEVTFTTEDGVDLSAWYLPSKNGAALIVRHGSGSTGSDVLAQAAVLAKHGYGLLITDARGHGRSGGRAMDFGWYGDKDIRAAADFLVTQPGIDPEKIGAVGFSMGGEEAIGAMAADARIKAIVAEGATQRTREDKVWMADTFGVAGSIQQALDWFKFGLADLLTSASRPITLAKAVEQAAPRQVLMITAGTVEDEGYAAEHMQKSSPDRVSIWNVPGAGHTGGFTTSPELWEKTVTGFLDEQLGVTE